MGASCWLVLLSSSATAHVPEAGGIPHCGWLWTLLQDDSLFMEQVNQAGMEGEMTFLHGGISLNRRVLKPHRDQHESRAIVRFH